MHYSWDTEERARRALRNVSAMLQPGGCFIGTMPDADVLVRKLRDGCFSTPKYLNFIEAAYSFFKFKDMHV